MKLVKTDEYGEVINHKDTYEAIARDLFENHSVIIGYDDGLFGYSCTDSIVNGLIRDTELKTLKVYENHNDYAGRWGHFWCNVIVICEWEIEEPKPETIEWNGKKYVKEEFEEAIKNLKEVEE